MPDNLIGQIQTIEQEADQIVQGAHDDATQLDKDADKRIEQLEAELDAKFNEQSAATASRIEDERKAEEDQLRAKSQESLETIKGLDVAGATALIEKVVERITGS
ncbi:MAG: hypothetical protein HQ592_04880 [Planctomycetes bacterium]|nr:hypothetical protein [Planctomycetota bacterium]